MQWQREISAQHDEETMRKNRYCVLQRLPGSIVDERILIKLVPSCLAGQARGWNKLYVDLTSLPGILHLLIGLWSIFGVGQFNRHLTTAYQYTIQTGYRTLISPQPQFDPKDYQTGIGVSAAHIADQLQFIRAMLVWMMHGPVGSVSERLQCAVIPVLPTIDILSVCPIADCRFGYTVFLCV